jgi:hypothetical protein
VRRAALALLAVAALAGAGCGGGEDNDESATQLLERGFATDVDTGVFTMVAEVELDGGPVDGPFRLELEGPFRAAGSPTEMPDLDLTFRASGAGQEYEGRTIVTRENAWVEFEGETYEVGEELWAQLLEALEQPQPGQPETLEEAGVDPLDWVEGLEEDGEERVGGVAATKVTGTIDIEAMLRDFDRLAGRRGIPEDVLDQAGDVVDDVEFDTWIDANDVWRRIAAETEFSVPEDQRDAAGGLEGGSVSLDMTLDDPNEPVEIEGPAEARPIDELLRRLGVPPELLLGPGFAQPAPG